MYRLFFKWVLPVVVMTIVASTTAMLNTKVSSSKKMRLVYFDAKGVVEMTRIMLKIGKVDFEDSRFSIKVKEGGGFETPEFSTAKVTGDLKANMDRAPVLQVGEMSIGQSKAIERYVAKRCNMMGANEEVGRQQNFRTDCYFSYNISALTFEFNFSNIYRSML